MHAGRLSIAAALVVGVAGCGPSITVTSDWDPSVDFSTYETFAVLDAAGGAEGIDQFTHNRIMTAIADNLTAKGLRQVENPDNADLAAGWQLTTDQRSSYQTVSTGWGGYGRYGGGWYGGWGGGMTTSRTTETRYEVGTLVIALFDETKDQMIFTATGSKQLAAGDLTPDEAQRRIKDAVDRILRDFPPEG